MAANDKPTAPTKITGVVHTLLEGLHSMSKTETLMGQPYTLGDATIVPIHRLRVALGAGAVHGGAKADGSSGESGALGAGGVVKIEVTGAFEFRSVTIDPKAVDPSDVDMLQDLVLAARAESGSPDGDA